jgi:DNA-binding NarL/FixJ family response regulator
MIRIIIADDHPMFIDGVKATLEGVKDIAITGEVLNGEQLLHLLNKKEADIILLDINMPGMNGLLAAAEIKKKHGYTAGKQVCKKLTDKLGGITETKQLCFRKPVKFQYT